MKLLLSPYFISLCLLYIINKLADLPLNSNSLLYLFLKNHFNDLLYIPISLTLCLACIRWVKKTPLFILNIGLIISMVIFCSLVFEYIGPNYYLHSTRDWIDVVMYVLGGVFYYFLQKQYVTISVK